MSTTANFLAKLKPEELKQIRVHCAYSGDTHARLIRRYLLPHLPPLPGQVTQDEPSTATTMPQAEPVAAVTAPRSPVMSEQSTAALEAPDPRSDGRTADDVLRAAGLDPAAPFG